MKNIAPIIALVAVILVGAMLLQLASQPKPVPTPEPVPAPCPGPGPCPAPKPRPWGPRGSAVGANVDGEEHNGVSVDCPLPPDFHTKNVGGSDGAGLCVFCSMHHSGEWVDEPVFAGIFKWMQQYPGGGYPEKVTKMVEKYAAELGMPVPDYIQVTGHDLEILKAACQSGRMPGVTYSFSPSGRYGGKRIAHMVSLVHADDHYFVILDNNYVAGEKHLEWLSPEEFSKTYAPGWAVIPLKPGPPMAPFNRE